MKPRLEVAAWVAVLGSCLGLLVYGAHEDGLTNDEILYLTAGQLQVQSGDFRLNPTHPPLASSIIGLGLAGGGFTVPDLPVSGDPTAISYGFVHEENEAGKLILRGRAPVVVVALGLVALAGGFARCLGGAGCGLIALTLAAFHPSLLAHGHLATTDVPAALFMLAGAFAFERWLGRPSLARSALFGLTFGLALATRVTSVLLLPALALALVVAFVRRSDARPRSRDVLALTLLTAVLVALVIWGSYGFRDTPWPGGLWKKVEISGPAASLVNVVERSSALPGAYLDGIRFQIEHARKGHPGYLLGERSKTGFPHFALVAFLTKNSLGLLLATALALATGIVRLRRPWSPRVALLLGLVASVFLATSLGRIQIGERYLLGAYGPLVILVGWALVRMFRRPWGKAAVALALLLHVGSSLLQAREGFISSFNLLAGGRQGGHRVLLDSSLDWGQDLPRLAQWMRREGIARIALGYHGVDNPARFGIAWDDLPGLTLYPARLAHPPSADVVVVSPNLLFGLVGRTGEPYADLRARPPDARAGVFFVYRRLDSPYPEAR